MSKIVKQVSQLSGELVASPVDVVFAPGFDIESLKSVDAEPVFATVKVKAGKGNGGKGPNYSPAILKSLEEQILAKRPSGYKGHQDPDKASYEWREPVTSWIGAKFSEEEQALYVKGYVPPTAPELRSWLNQAKSGADMVNSVSIWGLRDVKGDEVTNYDLWSLDWTPKGRAGMETELVSVSGEQKEEDEKEDDVDRDQVIASLTRQDIPDHLVEAIQGETRAESASLTEAIGEMRVILELDSDDPEAVVGAVRGLVEADRTEEFSRRIDSAVEEEVAGELMQTAVRERLLSHLSPEATDEEIVGEITAAKELPHIKALSGGRVPVIVTGGEGSVEGERKGTSWQ